jgi:hypothetical protein
MKAIVLLCLLVSASEVCAQSTTATPAPTQTATPSAAPIVSPSPRPSGRVSFYTTEARSVVTDAPSRASGEFASSITYQLPDEDKNGVDFGIDLRHAAYSGAGRLQRVSLYEGFAGGRFAGGRLRARAGHVWLNDLGALGAVAGAVVEYRQPSDHPSSLGRLRIGAFGGLEPQTFEYGYAPNVRKAGGYVALEGDHARRNVVGLVSIRDAALTERSVVTTTNFLPIGTKVFVYQAAEYDVAAPAGQGRTGLAYLFANTRVAPATRVELQGTYSRGRSVDTRGLSEDVLNGRALTRAAIDGLLYESAGGRMTVEVVPRVRVYGGYSRDVTNRDQAPTGRILLGGFAGNIAGSGFDMSASDSITSGPSRASHAEYVSLGREIGRSVYVYGDYSTSLSVLQFSRSDGVIIETRPHTRRMSGTATANLAGSTSLMITVDRTTDGQSKDFRAMTGITYRLR